MNLQYNETKEVVSKTFFWMFMGLLLTGMVSYYSYSSGLCYDLMIKSYFELILLIEFGVVILFNLLFKKLSKTGVTLLFLVYALLNGVTLSTIFYVFQIDSIYTTFIGSAFIFGALGLIGSKTETDLTKLGTLCMYVLIFSIILSIVNIFIGSNSFDLFISWVVLLAFFGVTAYDMQKLKLYANSGMYGDKLHIYFALELYLDFINIFIRLLSIFGKRK